MKKHGTSDSNVAKLTISLPQELQQQVRLIAMQQGETFSDIICMAVTTYITTYSQQVQPTSRRINLDEARSLMREFGQGLGTGQAPHNGARCHDTYLYNHK